MQRRLQRNASLEGVRPSPLAQQPPQSPGTSAPVTLPPHGMIQVLPMPGMGMVPVVRPQPKEPPKPKRNVCGPAPPPPPFSISGESSIEHSPSATPLITPASTPASSSGISSAATSALSSQSTAPVSYSNSLETDEQLLKEKLEKAAEPGSNIPSPPPLPPSSTASHKRYSLPSLSSQQSSSSSRPESESLQSSLSTFSSSNDASKSSSDLPSNEKEDIKINTTLVEEKSESAIENENVLTSVECDTNQENQKPFNETIENNKEISNSYHDQESKIVIGTNEEQMQTNSAEILPKDECTSPKVDYKSESRNEEERQSIEKIEPQTDLDKKVTTESSSLSSKTKTLSQPQTNHCHDNIPVHEIEQIKENTLDEAQLSSEVFSSNTMSLEKSNVVEQKVLPQPVGSRQNITSINIQQNQSTSPTDKRNQNVIPTERINAGVANNKASPNTQENLHNATSASFQPIQPGVRMASPPTEVKKSQNSIPIEKVNAGVANIKTSQKTQEHLHNATSVTFQPFRPGVRMASPPTEVKRSQNSNFERMTRQASLPADASSPQGNVNIGSIYVPPVRQTSSESVGQSKSAPQSAQCLSSSPTGLNKGPLPWMRGVRKEPSPPPEFLIYAQKAQDRIQRQRSLTQQDNNRQQMYNPRENETNLQQNGDFYPSTTYSPAKVATTKPTYNNEQYNWRIPAHQTSVKNQQHQQQQQTQQQKSQVLSSNQPQTQIGQQNQQSRFSQFSKQQSMTLPKNRPRERIIPIMMEDYSPVTPTSNIQMPGGTNTLPNKMNYQPLPQRQQSWTKPSSVPSSPMGTNAAFFPYDQGNYHSSSNALEALQQMQQNLAKLNCGLQTAQTPGQQNGVPFVVQHTGSHDPVQSRSFKVLQNAYDQQDPSGPPTEVSSEPRKYAGSHIPSRSFRMLQTMTDDVPSDDSSSYQEMLRRDESTERGEDPNSSSNISKKTLSSSIHSPITPSSSSASVALSDCDIGSRVAPSYTNTSDSYVYRHVSPKIISNSPSAERVVNSALCARRDVPSKIWQKDCISNGLQNCGSQHSIGSQYSIGSQHSLDSPEYVESPPRLLNIIKQENSGSGNDSTEHKRLYGGGNIPSRAFRQLQNDYSNTNAPISSPASNSSTSSSNRVTEVYIPRVMQQLRLDQRHASTESINSLDEHIRNGVLDTASAKESVLKELTSQFDPQMSLKKPKAAPGRVFRYLQEVYDDPQDSDFVSMTSSSNGFSNNDSPSFSSVSSGIESSQGEIEPKPYAGCRIPGRTFRLLQENMDTHPTVLQARK